MKMTIGKLIETLTKMQEYMGADAPVFAADGVDNPRKSGYAVKITKVVAVEDDDESNYGENAVFLCLGEIVDHLTDTADDECR